MRTIDYARHGETAEHLRDEYRGGSPFPHIVIDEFLRPGSVEAINRAFPDPDQEMIRKSRTAILDDGRVAQSGKRNYRYGEVDEAIEGLFAELNTQPFIQWLESLTGINALLPDPRMRGGGIHVTEPGGLLRVHADFNKHPLFGLDRRINVLIYLNEDWQEDYGGHLELWNSDVSQCEKRILPIANRCVIFNTSSDSFHGHPQPLTCPQGRERRSIAMYYYSNGRPPQEQREKHATLWPLMPGETV